MEKYTGNNRFVVYIGQSKISFAKVSNIVHSVEYEAIPVGGINTAPHMAVTQGKQLQTITFERAVQSNDDIINKLTPGVHLGKEVEIVVLDNASNSNKDVHCYYFEDGIVTKFEISNLDALGNEILIQKLEIVHTGLHQTS